MLPVLMVALAQGEYRRLRLQSTVRTEVQRNLGRWELPGQPRFEAAILALFQGPADLPQPKINWTMHAVHAVHPVLRGKVGTLGMWRQVVRRRSVWLVRTKFVSDAGPKPVPVLQKAGGQYTRIAFEMLMQSTTLR